MMSDLERACQHLDIDPGRVVKHRNEGDEYVVLANYGIGGVKKHRVPLSRIPEPQPDPLDDLSYRELQGLAKQFDIPANQSAVAIREALASVDVAVDEEE